MQHIVALNAQNLLGVVQGLPFYFNHTCIERIELFRVIGHLDPDDLNVAGYLAP